jgi:hypothetical protein
MTCDINLKDKKKRNDITGIAYAVEGCVCRARSPKIPR